MPEPASRARPPDVAVAEASAWVRRWTALVAPGARVLDVACGRGRHLRWFRDRGCRVTGIDRDADALAAAGAGGGAEAVLADLENGPWPLPGRVFDAVVVTHYLWRALRPALHAALAPGGVLIYETFADGNAAFGRPANPDFLLRHGELLDFAAGLRVVAYEDGYLDDPPRCVQRLVAWRDDGRADPHYPGLAAPGS